MPPQTPQGGAQVRAGGLMAKYGAKLDGAVKAHAGDETDYGQMRLPPGINNGIAQLKVCTFGVYKTGKTLGHYFLRMAGVVITPREVNVGGVMVTVAGQQTSMMIPLCDTTNSKNELITTDMHVADILNEFRKLGADTSGMDGSHLESIAAMLAEAKPYFHFSTVFLPPLTANATGRTFENWFGSKGLETYDPAVDAAAPTMVNDGGSAEDPDPMSPEPEPAVDDAPPPDEPAVGTDAAPEGEGDGEDLNALAVKADAGDLPSMKTLTSIALKLEIPQEDIDAVAKWADLIEAIEAAKGDEAAAEAPAAAAPAADAPWAPIVGETYDYSYQDVKTKKLVKCNHNVTAVNVPKQTINLLNLVNNTAVKDVPWGKLETAS